jgi:hypothetical protein
MKNKTAALSLSAAPAFSIRKSGNPFAPAVRVIPRLQLGDHPISWCILNVHCVTLRTHDAGRVDGRYGIFSSPRTFGATSRGALRTEE